jgi:hypothetical protein
MSICTSKTKIDGHRLFYKCKNYHVFSTQKMCTFEFLIRKMMMWHFPIATCASRGQNHRQDSRKQTDLSVREARIPNFIMRKENLVHGDRKGFFAKF